MIEYKFSINEELQDLIDTSITDKDIEDTYGALIKHFIRQYYSSDSVEAILNNKLAEPSEEHEADFNDLQSCRASAKAYAKQLLGLD